MGYRARVEPPNAGAYVEIFKRQAYTRGIRCEQPLLDHVLNKYRIERRQMKGCEPRDLLDRVTDICLFEGQGLELTPKVVDVAWRNYFGTAHTFSPAPTQETMIERTLADPLEL
jgi:chromosomal replication initiation ATPase DnaA